MDRDKISAAKKTPKVLRSATKPLTTTAIGALKPGKMLADGAIRPGSGSLKIRKRQTAGGVVAEWLFEWHRDGKTVRHSIGRYSASEVAGCLTLAQARAQAADLQATVRAGESPVHKRDIEREAARVRQSEAVHVMREASERTLSALLATYIGRLRSKGKENSAYDAENIFSNHVEKAFPNLAALPAAQITPEHISRMLARLVGPDVQSKKGRTALKLRSYMAAAFKSALGASTNPMAQTGAASFGLTGNPAASISITEMAEVFNKTGERTLNEDELRHYLAHLAAWPAVLPRLALQLQLVAGGQRMQQLLRLTHGDVSEHTITLRDPKGKRSVARLHVLPIVPEIASIIDALRAINPVVNNDRTALLFASRGAVIAPETLSVVVQNICTAMMVSTGADGAPQAATPFRGGDIRRTVETMLSGKLHVSKDVRAQLLSHGLTGVQDVVYDKDLHLAAKSAALRAWNDYIADVCIGTPTTGNVTPIRRAA
ncbi:MAG: hypothetical protein EOP81_02205 [Variovorax sp.]|nr:MAG: hypothetical protein EOP81_02205 [Variovorax sp.]